MCTDFKHLTFSPRTFLLTSAKRPLRSSHQHVGSWLMPYGISKHPLVWKRGWKAEIQVRTHGKATRGLINTPKLYVFLSLSWKGQTSIPTVLMRIKLLLTFTVLGPFIAEKLESPSGSPGKTGNTPFSWVQNGRSLPEAIWCCQWPSSFCQPYFKGIFSSSLGSINSRLASPWFTVYKFWWPSYVPKIIMERQFHQNYHQYWYLCPPGRSNPGTVSFLESLFLAFKISSPLLAPKECWRRSLLWPTRPRKPKSYGTKNPLCLWKIQSSVPMQPSTECI